MTRWVRPGAAGVAAALLGVGAGEALAALVGGASSPVFAVASALVDSAPAWAKETAIAWFGTGDKTALVVGIAIVLFLVAAASGVLEARWRWSGRAVLLLSWLGAIIAVATRADFAAADVIPGVVGAGVASVALVLLVRVGVPRESLSGSPSGAPAAEGRRRFLLWAGGATVLGVIMVAGGTLASGARRAAVAARDSLRLPFPATPVPIPPDTSVDVAGMTPFVTPNESFYRIDVAFQVPEVAPVDWSLRIHGLVEEEVTIGWDELLALPMAEYVTTLMCVSNEVGGELIGNAVWLGTPIRDLLARARPLASADMLLSSAPDGFTAGTPLEALTDERNAILAVGMNGTPLPLVHGYPVRMVVPGLYGYVSGTKWVTDWEVTRFADASSYWTDRGWSPRGPIKIGSRIDVPRGGADVSVGTVPVAGVAWHQHVGLSGVQVQVDQGPWQDATLAPGIGVDTWQQWVWQWDAQPGDHVLRVRALDADGTPQTDAIADVVPDGATGLDSLRLRVG